MYILFLSTWYPHPVDNGSKLRVNYLLRSLGRSHQVTLISFVFGSAQTEASIALTEYCREIQVVTMDPFAANRASSLRTFISLRPMANRPHPVMSKLVARSLQEHSFDVVIVSTGMMMDYARFIPKGTVIVLEEHNSLTRWSWEKYRAAGNAFQRARRWLSWYKIRRYEAHTFSRFDLITMVSDADRLATMDGIGALDKRVEVVPNGADCGWNIPGLATPRPNSLVFSGSLTYSANYDAMRWFLVHVYPLLKSQQPQVSLTITGSTYGVNLDQLALDESIVVTGFVEDVRVPIAEAVVSVVPIWQGGGTRLKILEAMALGTPVVATTKGAEGLEVVDGEHLLLADTPHAFASAVLGLLADADARARLARNARYLVETQYDWAAIGDRFVRLVENVVEKRNAPPVRGGRSDG